MMQNEYWVFELKGGFAGTDALIEETVLILLCTEFHGMFENDIRKSRDVRGAGLN